MILSRIWIVTFTEALCTGHILFGTLFASHQLETFHIPPHFLTETLESTSATLCFLASLISQHSFHCSTKLPTGTPHKWSKDSHLAILMASSGMCHLLLFTSTPLSSIRPFTLLRSWTTTPIFLYSSSV